jgi:hypothetical protein
MNWWKTFKQSPQLSEEEILSFLSYLRLEDSLPAETPSTKLSIEFPSIQHSTSSQLVHSYLPSEQYIQWANWYLVQSSNRFDVTNAPEFAINEHAFQSGKRFAQEMSAFSQGSVFCIADFPTEQILSFAFGAMEICEPILGFDSIPHPLGITDARKLCAMLFQWKNRWIQSQSPRLPLLLIDSNRLIEYHDAPDLFDNRTTAKLPTIESLKLRNIDTIIYATNSNIDIDDVHEDFCYYSNAGITLRWFNSENNDGIVEKKFQKRSTMFSKRISFINKL